jgi:hypothetical protein
VHALERQPGSEILAVQPLRNSLMSATVVASTAALALLGSFSVGLPFLVHGTSLDLSQARALLLLVLMLALFASLLSAALATRLFNHAGFMLSFPAGSDDRLGMSELAADYLRRAGHHYGRSLHVMLLLAPLLVGMLAPLAMPFATVAWLVALMVIYDRAPPQLAIEQGAGGEE